MVLSTSSIADPVLPLFVRLHAVAGPVLARDVVLKRRLLADLTNKFERLTQNLQVNVFPEVVRVNARVIEWVLASDANVSARQRVLESSLQANRAKHHVAQDFHGRNVRIEEVIGNLIVNSPVTLTDTVIHV